MRYRKIRGNNRRLRNVESWRLYSLKYGIKYVKINERDHFDIVVHPWCDISATRSAFPEPNGKIRKQMLEGLLDIYDDCKIKLDELGQPYYLSIWLYEPRFSKSQVVCAIGDSLNFYNTSFFKPNYDKRINLKPYGNLKERLSQFNWSMHFDEDVFFNNQVGSVEQYCSIKDYEETVTWFNKLLKRPHRTDKITEEISDVEEMYFFKQGYVWIGEHSI